MRTYLFVAYHVATANLAKARKNELQILAARHGIELAHKKHVLGRLDVGIRQVADDFKRQGGGFRVSAAFDGLLLVVLRTLACRVIGVRTVGLIACLLRSLGGTRIAACVLTLLACRVVRLNALGAAATPVGAGHDGGADDISNAPRLA